ncbi:MAG TPA: alpha/beta hydrolase [Mycobacteriales bacterium]
MPRIQRHRWRTVAVAAATLTTITMAPASAAPTSAPAGAVPANSLPTAAEVRTDAVPTPRLDWTDCGEGFQCATAQVPLDYAHPHEGTVTLAVNRLPATDPAHRIGSLFVNPGGPGGSGLVFARTARQIFEPAVLARFDIVGFDPRGVGQSTPAVTCFDSQAGYDEFWAAAFFPVSAAEETSFATRMAGLSQDCGRRNGDLLEHVTTTDAAEDLDLLRRAVGDEQLSLHGYSYGSYLGEVYANLYPDRIRAMVLDGVIDPVAWANEPLRLLSDSAVSDEQTFDAFARQCVAAGPPACALARSGQDARALRDRLDQMFDRLRANPLVFPGDPPFVLTYQFAVTVTLQSLYSPAMWPGLAGFLAALDQATLARTTTVPAGVAALAVPTPESAEVNNESDAFTAIFCTDTSLPRAPAAWPALARLMGMGAPTFSRPWLFEALPCATWPARAPERYTGPFDRPTSATLLLVNTTFDRATSYAGAQRTVGRLGDARLLTIDGFGHTSRRAQSTCATTAIDRYLLGGDLPVAGAHCAIDHGPFGGAGALAVPALAGLTTTSPHR